MDKQQLASPVLIESRAGPRQDVRVIKVTGALTAFNLYEFQEVCLKESAPLLIIDLAAVPFMDSAALGCLLTVHMSRERRRRKYALIKVPQRLLSMFAICGVNTLLNIYSSMADAETALL